MGRLDEPVGTATYHIELLHLALMGCWARSFAGGPAELH